MNINRLVKSLDLFWEKEIVPVLKEYIKIPNKSPAFDPDWENTGHMQAALNLALEWTEKHKPVGSILHVKKTPGRTPLLMLEIPGKKEGNVLIYGHLDKQPEMEGWREDLGPWKPVLENGRLYGRGGADDGYALFAAVGITKALIEQGCALPRIVIFIEFCEESGSPDLPFYIENEAELIGSPDLVVCLDSGAENYDQLWITVSLRGLLGCMLQVNVLTEGVHSGGASGLIPSSFRILRQLISRIEDENTGEIIPKELHVEIPRIRIKEVEALVAAVKDMNKFPIVPNLEESTSDPVEGVLRRTWRPALSIVGMDGIPGMADGGNVLRPSTGVKLSLRLPPGLNAKFAKSILKKILTENPPYDAQISVKFEEPASGWNAPEFRDWLTQAVQAASETIFNKPALSMGEGGSIPFMAMLGKKFPGAQFIITGVLGPHSNAHGPNEFLHIAYARKLSACIAMVLDRFQK